MKFAPNTDTFSVAGDSISTLTFQLAQNGHDIWLDYAMLAAATDVTPDIFSFVPVDQTSEFIARCASQQHFYIDFYTSGISLKRELRETVRIELIDFFRFVKIFVIEQ